MATTRPSTPWWNGTVGTAAYTVPKSATTAPEASVVSDTGATGSSTIRVRTGTRSVHGADRRPAERPAGDQARSSNPGSSHPAARPDRRCPRCSRPGRPRGPAGCPGSQAPFCTRHDPSVDHPVDVPVGVVDGDLGDHPRAAGRMSLGGTLPVGHHSHRVGGAGPEQGGDVEGLVVLRVGIAVRLALAGPDAVDVQLVLLVARHVGPGPVDRTAPERELGAGVGVLVGLGRRVDGPPDPRGPPVAVVEAGLERGRRRPRSGDARRRPRSAPSSGRRSRPPARGPP